MTQTDKSTSQNQFPLGKQMIVRAWIGLVLISLFLLSAEEGNPAWGKLWVIRPLIIVPLAGAMGGLCSYFFVHFHDQVGVNKTVAMFIGVIVSIIGLWLGVVLGLDGTMWD